VMRKSVVLVVLVGMVSFGWSSLASAVPIEWTVGSGGNGHFYELIGDSLLVAPTTWADQQARAVARGGYLATITSEAENRFISIGVSVGSESGCKCVWLGGFQNHSSPTYSEPGGGWEWVTGEPWSYTHWAPGEPQNSGHGSTEDFLTVWFSADPGNVNWNDHPDFGSGRYLIEWDSNPVPEPNTALLLGVGLLGLGVKGRRRGRAVFH
jgi:hypothetical protein